MRIALFNDTGTQPHVGCLAVSAAHRLLLDRAGIRIARTYDGSQWHELTRPSLAAATEAALASHALRAVFTDVDAVVVNGEGTIHHAGGQHLLAILAAAAWVGRPALLVNAVLQDIDEARPVLAVLDDCTVRDARSARYLRRLGVPHRLVPDSIFNAPFVAEPCHDFSGALVVTDCHPARTAEFAPALDQLRRAWRSRIVDYPLRAPERRLDWQHAAADLQSAVAVVTGRHHGACLALRAGVPFVTLPSNTWKIEGLLDMLDGYPAAAADQSLPLETRVAAALAARDWFVAAGAAWRAMPPLDTFAVLALERAA